MSTTTHTDTLEMGRLASLISPIGGVISGLERLGPNLTRSTDTVTMARLGEVGALRRGNEQPRFGVELDGIGCHRDPEISALIATIEALERYSAAVVDERRWRISSAGELGDDAIDFTGAARCSAAELAAPECPVTAWDPTQPMRWVRGWSLLSGEAVWVPAVLAHLGIGIEHPGERFAVQCSSGCAAGRTKEEALLGACFELIERDAVSIAWLQRLALPRLPLDELPAGWRSSHEPDADWETVAHTLAADQDGRQIALFDATSDLAVPTVLAVLLPPPGSGLPPAVGAGCADVAARAALKAVREVTVVRACLWSEASPAPPAEVPAEAFDHLFVAQGDDVRTCRGAWEAPRRSASEQMQTAPADACVRSAARLLHLTVAQRLPRAVSAVATDSRDVVAIDLTPIELRDREVYVMRVIAPALMPFLADHRARYLASPRLYAAPARLGWHPRTEAEVNPWPSPLW